MRKINVYQLISWILPIALMVFSTNTFGQTFSPMSGDTYTINSPFSKYDITNKGGSGVAEMGSRPYNQWVFEKASDNAFRIKEVKTGKYLHIQNANLEVGNIQPNWWSALWELEHVTDNYYRIKCKWHKFGKPLYIQNPKRSLSIGELADKNATYGRWRVRKEGGSTAKTKPSAPTAKVTFDGAIRTTGSIVNSSEDLVYVAKIRPDGSGSVSSKTVFTVPNIPPIDPEGQGGEGSCVAWACAYTALSHEMYEARKIPFKKSNGDINRSAVASPEYLFNRINSNDSDCSDGSYYVPTTNHRGALSVMKREGVTSWFDVPYSDRNGCGSVNNVEEPVHPNAKGNKIKDFERLQNVEVNTIKALLHAGKPIIFSAKVTNEFMRARGPYVWYLGVGGPSSGHAMVLIGYDDNKRAYKIQNSWGTDWGDNGYGWIGYDIFKSVIRYDNFIPRAFILNGSDISNFKVEEESYVSVFCEAGYVINCKLSYTYNGRRVNFDENVILWQSFRKHIPKGATNVVLEVNSIACIDHLNIKKTYTSSKIQDCYKVWGTIFDTEYGPISCEY